MKSICQVNYPSNLVARIVAPPSIKRLAFMPPYALLVVSFLIIELLQVDRPSRFLKISSNLNGPGVCPTVLQMS